MGKRKRLSCVIIALVLAVSLTACQQGELLTNTAGETGTYETSDKLTIPVTKNG